MMAKKFSVLALAGILTLAPGVAEAQVTPPPGGQRQRMELERRLQQGFQRSIQTQLGFNQEKMLGVRGVMQSFQEDRQTLNRAQASLRYRLRDPALRELGEDDARAILREMLDLQKKELDLYQKEQGEFLKVMAPAELVRFYGIREALGMRVQQVRQGRGPGGGGAGGQGVLPAGRGGGGGGDLFR